MLDIINFAMKCFDKTGKKIGMLTVLELVDKVTIKNKKHNRYRCVCDCGEEVIRLGSSLHGRKAGSCGCMNRRQNLIGQTFGKLTVLKESEIQPDSDGWQSTLWDCQCECGVLVSRKSNSLRSSSFSSCGCDRIKPASEDRESYLWEKAHRISVIYAQRNRDQLTKSDITVEDFKKIASQNCVYCNAKPEKLLEDIGTKSKQKLSDKKIYYSTLDRIDPGINYFKHNVVPACDTCNTAKMALSFFEWATLVKRIHDHLYLNGGINKILGVKDSETSFFFPSTKNPTHCGE